MCVVSNINNKFIYLLISKATGGNEIIFFGLTESYCDLSSEEFSSFVVSSVWDLEFRLPVIAVNHYEILLWVDCATTSSLTSVINLFFSQHTV